MSKNMMIAVVALILLVGGFMYVTSARRAEKNSTMTAEESMTLAGDAGKTDDTDTTMVKDDGSMGTDGTMTVTLAEVAASATKQTGTATLTEKNGKVEVVVNVSPAESASQPAHIHVGTCPGVGAVAYALTDIVAGKSTTLLNVSLAELKAKKPLAINIHKSADEVKQYTACGNL